jgi:16S rRNA (guanine527-N7)-methyltransferase
VEQRDLRYWADKAGILLSTCQEKSFLIYLNELKAWNRKINLTAITDPQQILLKHFVDSMTCGRGLVEGIQESSLLDVGSGGGFPGVPLKIIHPDLRITLLEPNLKKTAFLRHLIGTLQLKDIHVVSQTLMDFSSQGQYEKYFCNIISRAFDLLPHLHHCFRLLNKGGRVILCRSKPLSDCETLAGFIIEKEMSYTLPEGYGTRTLSLLTSLN